MFNAGNGDKNMLNDDNVVNGGKKCLMLTMPAMVAKLCLMLAMVAKLCLMLAMVAKICLMRQCWRWWRKYV